MHSRRLANTIEYGTDRPISGSRDVDPPEHVFQNLKRGAVVVADARRIEGFLQSVEQEIGLVDVECGVPLLPAQRANVAQIHGQARRQAARYRERQVLSIWIPQAGLRIVNLLAAI